MVVQEWISRFLMVRKPRLLCDVVGAPHACTASLSMHKAPASFTQKTKNLVANDKGPFFERGVAFRTPYSINSM